jgi:hypothetical protein
MTKDILYTIIYNSEMLKAIKISLKIVWYIISYSQNGIPCNFKYGSVSIHITHASTKSAK